MELTRKIQSKIEKILNKLKALDIIETYKLELNFCQVEESFKTTLLDVDSVLKKCLRKIMTKPKKAEIRNVITELLRKKNLGEEKAETLSNLNCEFKYINQDCLEYEKSQPILCEKCGEIFENYTHWGIHIEEHRKENMLYINPLISQSIDKPNKDTKLLPEKINKQTVKSDVSNKKPIISNNDKFICKCGKEFLFLKALKKHESLKHSIKSLIFNCTKCEKSFKEKGKMNRHLLSHSQAQYKCPNCQKLFNRSDSLKRHLSIAHFPQQYFSCSFCQKTFNLKYNKDVHEETIHKKVFDNIQCHQCGNKFKNKLTFKTHLKTHMGKKFVCKICGKGFARKIQQTNHLKNSHNEIFIHFSRIEKQNIKP